MKIIIIGAGISGLLSAYYLVKGGCEVEIFEKSDRPGGLIKTFSSEFGPMDYAASSLVNSEVFEDIFNDIGLELATKGSLAKIKYIYRNSIRRWPLNLFESLRFMGGVVSLILSKDKGLSKGRSINNWGEAFLGKAGYRYTLETFLQGVYAGDGRKMSASLILSNIFGKKNKQPKKRKPQVRGSVMPLGGMEQLTNKLALYLEKNSVKINYNVEVSADDIDASQITIIASSAPATGKLLKQMGVKEGAKLMALDMLDLASVHLVFKQGKTLFNGYGCLFPVSEGFNCLGVLAGQNGFPDEYSNPVERWIIGGAYNRNVLSQSDEKLINLALVDRKKLSNKEEKPIAAFILRRPQSLPHYTPELEKIIDNLCLPKNLFLAGNYLGGIGLSAIIRQSQTLAKEIKAAE
ncbi:MAG: NAD(P)-binding protein [Devosiaceae bacterium]|nr:NAD(P)-binding protein [Devosiaceae bacterium]